MATEQEHLAAVLAAINAQSGAAYSLSDIKKSRPTPSSYNEVTVSRRFVDAARTGDAAVGITSWRVTARAVAQIEGNAHVMRARARAGLENARLVVDGVPTGPIQFETGDPIADDDGWWSGLETWTYDHGL